jgi:photosystem II stability/assembly factor-like uncharacterized protein
VTTLVGVGPTLQSFPRLPANDGHSSTGRMTALVLAADGNRMYAGNFAGVWRSDDGGEIWLQLTWPQPLALGDVDVPGALYGPHVFDLATSPADSDVVLACAMDSQFADSRDGIYRTVDGGDTWTLVLPALEGLKNLNVAFAPDDGRLALAVGSGFIPPNTTWGVVAVSQDAGQTWKTQFVGSSLWHVVIAPLEADGTRRVYAVGNAPVGGNEIWYSSDGGQTWLADGGVATIVAARSQLSMFQKTCDPNAGVGGFGSQISYAGGNAGSILAVEPGDPARVYLATTQGANGPSYYADTIVAGGIADGTLVNTTCLPAGLAGEASLWLGDFSQFAASGSAQWSQLPGPPVYRGYTSPSGNTFVAAKQTSAGFLIFFSDNSHVHVSSGTPTAHASWHRLDGLDASAAKREGKGHNVLFMHADPHAIAFSSDFEITLKPPAGVEAPYDQNSELDQHLGGTLWMANDGGVYRCDDGGVDESSWQMPTGLETIDPVNIAGLSGVGGAPALYFGCGDNNDFFSLDGGAQWGDPGSGCGDCDAWFADTPNRGWVLQFLPRRGDATGYVGMIGIIKNGLPDYPDASNSAAKTFVPSPKKVNFNTPTALEPYAASDVYLIGYRPLIKTLPGGAVLPDGDVVIVEQQQDGTATLFRTTAITSIKTASDWHDPAKAQQIGPTLPAGAIAVQASGGHLDPVFYVGDRTNLPGGGNVWRLSADQTQWNPVVPSFVGSPVYLAEQWFVDPYDPDLIYVLDVEGVKLSFDGGGTWYLDTPLTTAVTGGGLLTISPSLLQDMHFCHEEPQTRFAMGTAGVFCTMDWGESWFSVLNSIAFPGRPESGFFDPVSDPNDRAFYVECESRSVLRIGGLPEPPPEESGPIDLMEFAALDY